MRILIVIILMLLTALAHGQTHTMPGTNNVPSGASLILQSGSTTDFNAGATVDFTGATVTGLAGGGAVSSVFTRTGAVVALVGDYSAFYQPLDTDLTTWAGLTPSANFQTMVPHTFSQMRTDLSLVIGTNVQAWHTNLDAWSALAPSAKENQDPDLDTWATKTPYAGTVTVTTAKTFNCTGNLTLSGTDGSTLNIGAGGTLGTAAYTASTAYQGTLTNSAGLRGALSDENGTGAALFSGATSPTFATSVVLGNVGIEAATDTLSLRNSSANTMTTLRIMPRGTVAGNSAYMQLLSTDFIADSANYRGLSFSAGDTLNLITSISLGTQVKQPIVIAADATQTQIYAGTTGGVSVGAATDPGVGTINANVGYKVANAAASGKVLQGDGTKFAASTPTWPTAAGTAGYTLRSDGTNVASYPQDMMNSSTADGSGYAADTYLVGSSITVAAGDIKAKGQYHCVFDMVKTGAGVATPVITLRVGTTGTISDSQVMVFQFGAGTAVADTGKFEIWAVFRGTGGSAAVRAICKGSHNLATTGLFNNAAEFTILNSGSASTTSATNIGISFNGGASFSGTNAMVQAQLIQ